ncbi:MAG: M28 family peptidase [Verrucomicrobia bacterium]|jgi:glutaminyl-peptide cyclotransferase|nr:M28 family peptidase [Verrucomicrobiota bacterium]
MPASVDGVAALDEVSRFVALGPRDAGTPGAARGAAYLLARLRGIGYRPLLDAFSESTPRGQVGFSNIIGVPPGYDGSSITKVLQNSAGPVVILLSHYDTKTGISETFGGANDSGSSTGLLLHLGRLLSAQKPPLPLVLLAFVDGEECHTAYGTNDGLHGSRHLAQQIESSGQAGRVQAVIVLDMIGDADLNVRIPPNTTQALLADALTAAEAEGVRKQFGISKSRILDDHVPFLERRIPAIDLIDFEYGSAPGLNDYWHTEADTMDKLSAESLATVGRVVLRMLQNLGL